MFDPKLIFVTLWIAQILGHLLIFDIFNPLNIFTWFLVVFTIFSFFLGSYFITFKASKTTTNNLYPYLLPEQSSYAQWISKIAPYVLIIYSIIAVMVAVIIVSQIGLSGLKFEIFKTLRQSLINDFSEERKFFGLIRVFFFGVGICIYMLCFSKELSITKRLAICFVGTLSAVMTTGRLALLLFFLAVSYIMYSAKIIKLKGIIVSFCIFTAIFLFLAVLLGKGDGTGEILGQVIWNFIVYFLGSLSTFDFYVTNNIPVIEGGALLPNSIRALLEPVVGYLPLKPPLNPFVSNPIEANTYTAIYPIYHDLGLIGIAIIFTLLGMFHQVLFNLQKSNTSLPRYLFALSLYPLVMTIFEEAYISSLGFWITLLFVPVLFKLSYNLFMCLKASTRI